MQKRTTAILLGAALALGGPAATAKSIVLDEFVLWVRTAIKVKGEIYDTGTEEHLGTGGLGQTCYHRVTFFGADDPAPDIRQYCEQQSGDWEADDWSPEYYALPDANILVGDSIGAAKEDREIGIQGFVRMLIERNNKGKPKAVSLRQRNAIGQGMKDGTPVKLYVGGGIVKGNPTAVADLPDFLQAIANQRPNLMLCGSSSRDVSTLIPNGVELNVVEDCTPDSDTQALLVTRGGAGNPSDVVLKAYVSQGGIVITEYSASDEIFNMVFDAGVVQGPGGAFVYGNCADNVNPEVQFHKKDPFWQAFSFVAQDSGTSGCGYSVEAFPGITSLGGWSVAPGSVQLGYRELGDGRVWLVESDWQDGNANFSETSRRMMGYMIMHR